MIQVWFVKKIDLASEHERHERAVYTQTTHYRSTNCRLMQSGKHEVETGIPYSCDSNIATIIILVRFVFHYWRASISTTINRSVLASV